MSAEAPLKTWSYSPEQEARFQEFLKNGASLHPNFGDVRNSTVHWTPLARPLSQCRVALLSTGGVHLKSQKPFHVEGHEGDWSFREIPSDTPASEFQVTHTHYNHDDADQDINCMFPVDRLRELREEGFIGELTPTFFGFMGFMPDPVHLVQETTPQAARWLKEEAADLALLTCG
ncbi:MAG: glycine/sarcosine/betaine reductase selenoprotein B family protein [Dehalococcoidia bacterium]